MTDYQGNSKRQKEEAEKAEKAEQDPKTSKSVEKVIKGEVVIKKKSMTQRFRDTFIAADVPSVIQYAIHEVVIPQAKILIFDTISKASERLMFGESARRRGTPWNPGAPRYNYQRHSDPINRHPREQTMRYSPSTAPGPRTSSRYVTNEFILEDKDEADLVLERMFDVLDEDQVVTMATLLELLGERTSHTDYKYGWSNLAGSRVRQIRDGYLIELPPPEPIQ